MRDDGIDGPPWRQKGAETDQEANSDPPFDPLDIGLDDAPIPPRAWLLANVFCRTFPSSLVGAGAAGKTSVRIAQLFACATGVPRTGEHVFGRYRVLLCSFEDNLDEIRRRVRAYMLYYGTKREDVAGYFFIISLGGRHRLAANGSNGTVRATALYEMVENFISNHGIDIVCFDPFVKTHYADENANRAVDLVVDLLAMLGHARDIAVDTLHHTAKGPPNPGSADRARGASAYVDGFRLVYTLESMSEAEADLYGIPRAERGTYCRMDRAKLNLASSTGNGKWWRLVGQKLGNATQQYPNGDEVQIAVPWRPPDLFEGLDRDTLNAILDEIERGMPDGARYSSAGAAKERAAWRVVRKHATAKTEAQTRKIIRTWTKSGLLVTEEYTDPTRREAAKGLRVVAAKRPT